MDAKLKHCFYAFLCGPDKTETRFHVYFRNDVSKYNNVCIKFLHCMVTERQTGFNFVFMITTLAFDNCKLQNLQNNAQNLKIRRASFGAKQVCVKATVFIKEGVYTKKRECVRGTVCIKGQSLYEDASLFGETIYIKEGVYTKERV